jgi:cytochrome c-type biogenesis protein CcmF
MNKAMAEMQEMAATMIGQIGGGGDTLNRLHDMVEEERTKAAGRARVAKDSVDMTEVNLKEGETRELTDAFGHKWKFVSQGLSAYNLLNRQVTALALDVSRDGKRQGVLTSEKRQHVDSRGAPTFQPSTEVGIMGSWRQDVYVVLAGVRDDEVAEIRVTFNPLVRWVWLGGGLMALGGLIVMWPQAQRRRVESGYAAVMEPAPAEPEPVLAGV